MVRQFNKGFEVLRVVCTSSKCTGGWREVDWLDEIQIIRDYWVLLVTMLDRGKGPALYRLKISRTNQQTQTIKTQWI